MMEEAVGHRCLKWSKREDGSETVDGWMVGRNRFRNIFEVLGALYDNHTPTVQPIEQQVATQH